nr:MAG TPA: hypothetical protein [Caudoviricetes sp.]
MGSIFSRREGSICTDFSGFSGGRIFFVFREKGYGDFCFGDMVVAVLFYFDEHTPAHK